MTQGKKEISALCKDFIDFAKQDGTFHFSQWFEKQGKSAQWWDHLKKNHPELVECHNQVKQILGGKITLMAFENGNNWAYQTFIPMYLSDVQEHILKIYKEKAKIDAEEKKNILTSPTHPFLEKLLDYLDKCGEKF